MSGIGVWWVWGRGKLMSFCLAPWQQTTGWETKVSAHHKTVLSRHNKAHPDLEGRSEGSSVIKWPCCKLAVE